MAQLNKPWTEDPTMTIEAQRSRFRHMTMTPEEYMNELRNRPPLTPKQKREAIHSKLDQYMRDAQAIATYSKKNAEKPWLQDGERAMLCYLAPLLEDTVNMIYQLQSITKEGEKIQEERKYRPIINKLKMTKEEREEGCTQLYNQLSDYEAWTEFIRRHTMDPLDHEEKFTQYIEMVKDLFQLIGRLRYSTLVTGSKSEAPTHSL